MARTESYMLPLNTKAPHFSLTNGIDQHQLTLDQVKGSSGTLVIFMCNHCPYVLHLLDKMVEVSHQIKEWGINTVSISSNDVDNYPEDSPELMQKLAIEKSFGFPYLYDPTQEVALAYEAACTPDFYLFDQDLKLVYRGRFDDARPKNDNPVTGKDLMDACQKLSRGMAQDANQIPSLGCNIKWKANNEPKGFSI
ncbi:thioredoxin family protein [Flavobacteriaceae bacterium]|nr:thioredoxin family protein [Flavobacteriaceae bacterium]MDC0479097.1 thioredoxin family protein [Flavobacteriaceae bacterium]